ncbi:acyltransferase family protein [Massilia sp. SYSU DXS3249]
MEQGDTAFLPELKRFLFRRTVRIFPVYYLLLSALALVSAAGIVHLKRGDDLIYHFTYLSNILFGLVAKDWGGVFSHLWSLATEEQFYLFFAPLLLLVPARRHWQVCLGIVLSGLGTLLYLKITHAHPITVYTHPLTNFWLLALGGIMHSVLAGRAGAWQANRGHAWLAVGCLVCTAYFCAFLDWSALSAGTYLLASIAYALSIAMPLAWVVCNQSHRVVQWLEHSRLAALGKISYGFYLFHNFVPLLSDSGKVKAYAATAGVPDLVLATGSAILAFVISLVVAQLSWHFVEQRILVLKDRFAPGQSQHGASAPA